MPTAAQSDIMSCVLQRASGLVSWFWTFCLERFVVAHCSARPTHRRHVSTKQCLHRRYIIVGLEPVIMCSSGDLAMRRRNSGKWARWDRLCQNVVTGHISALCHWTSAQYTVLLPFHVVDECHRCWSESNTDRALLQRRRTSGVAEQDEFIYLGIRPIHLQDGSVVYRDIWILYKVLSFHQYM